MPEGGINWTYDPPVPEYGTAPARPILRETSDEYSYETPYGTYTFTKASPHRLRLDVASGTGVSAAWFRPTAPPGFRERNSRTLAANSTTFVSSYEVIVGQELVGSVQATYEFFPKRAPKASAIWAPEKGWESLDLTWIVVTRDKVVRYGNTSYEDFGSRAPFPLPDPDRRVQVGTFRMAEGEEPSALVDWADAPDGTTAHAGLHQTNHGVLAGILLVFPHGVREVDPVVFGSSTVATATAYSAQRKVLWTGDKHWVFYTTSAGMAYRTTVDGSWWSVERTFHSAATTGFDVAFRGFTVVVAWYEGTSLRFRTGSFYADTIVWSDPVPVGTHTESPPPSVAVAKDGAYWVAGEEVYRSTDGVNWQDKTPPGWASKVTPNSAVSLLPLSGTWGVVDVTGWVWALLNHDTSSPELLVGLYNASSAAWATSDIDTFQPAGVARYDAFSSTAVGSVVNAVYTTASSDTDYGRVWHLQVWPSSSFGVLWTDVPIAGYPTAIVGPRFPAVTWGPPGNVYAFWRGKDGSNWTIRNATMRWDNLWGETSTWFTPAPGQDPLWVSTPALVLNRVPVIWREANASLMFGSLVLLDDFGASASHPWARSGLTGNVPLIGEFGDFVNPSSGQLSVRQVDSQAPGRGLDLTISRIHVNPFAFQGSTPVLYETNPTVPMGAGWAVNLPWISDSYMHLPDGQRYTMIWNGSKFVNRAGTPFTLYNNWGFFYDLYLADGTKAGLVSTGGAPALVAYIEDVTGTNRLTFDYDAQERLINIEDTIGRMASLAYYASGPFAGRLLTLTHAGRTVQYGYVTRPSGAVVLSSVTYPLGLRTQYFYNTTNDYLITEVVAPWGGKTTYTYGTAQVGTEALAYVVTRQDVSDGTTLVRSRTFQHVMRNGWAMTTVIAAGDGILAKGYQILRFTSPTRGMTAVVQDANWKQMGKSVQWYGENGTVAQSDAYLGNGHYLNYSNVMAADDWGNPYYSRSAVSPGLSHERFASYGNTSSQNAFRAPGVLTMQTDGKVLFENFEQNGLYYWDWGILGSVTLDNTVWDRAPPSMKLAPAASATRYVPAVSGKFVFATSLRASETTKAHHIVLQYSSAVRAELKFDGDGWVKWRLPGGTFDNLTTYAANTWYRIVMQVDMGTAAVATIRLNENSYVRNVYQAGTVNQVRYELQAGGTNMWVGELALAKAGVSVLAGFLSFRVTGLTPGQKVEFVDVTDTPTWSGIADASGLVDVGADPRSLQVGRVKVYSLAGVAELSSPAWEFWPGSQYTYGRPYTYPEPKFYTNAFPRDVHDRPVGSLEWQTGRAAAPPIPQEMYLQYDPRGFVSASKVWYKQSGSWYSLESTFSTDAQGNLVQVEDVEGKVTDLDYGVAYSAAFPTRERRQTSQGPVTTRSTYNFDTGLPASVTGPRGFQTRFDHDSLGRRTAVRFFDGEPASEQLFYDMETLTAEATPRMEDLSAKGRHGTLVGSPEVVAGKVDRARGFDGTSEYVRAPVFPLTNQLTVSAWVKFNDGQPPGDYGGVVTNLNGYSNENRLLLKGASTVLWQMRVGTTTYNHVFTLPADQRYAWHHYALVYNGADVRLYWDGVQVGAAQGRTGNLQSGATLPTVGWGSIYSGYYHLNGDLDEVRVFNAELSAYDVAALFSLTYRQDSIQTATYDDAARRVTYRDEDTRAVRASFDGLGRRTKVERLNPDQTVYSTETVAYNWQDLPVIETSPTGNATITNYDSLGRPTSVQRLGESPTSFAYTDVALYQRVTDPSGHVRGAYRDFAGRTVKVEEAAGSATYAYDEVGNLLSVRNALSQQTLHAYDGLNRLRTTTYPDYSMEVFTYNDGGTVHQAWARNDSQTTFWYDDLYRLTLVDYSGSTADDVTYAYDLHGNPRWINNSVAKLTYVYDLYDRAISERIQFLGSGEPDWTTSFGYTDAGDLMAVTYPDLFQLFYVPDAFHRTIAAYNGGTDYATLTYHTDDAVRDVTFGNTLKTTVAYGQTGRPTSIVTKDGVTEKWSFLYAYDTEGNVLGLSGTGIPSQTFAYDATDRLTASAGNAWGDLSYVYDAIGNRKRIDALSVQRANGPGSPTQWQRIGCTVNWQCVDEGPAHDGDATYVKEWTNGDGDEYAIQDLTRTGAIASVTVTAIARDITTAQCDPPSDCAFYLELTVNGYGGGLEPLVSMNYQAYTHTWTTNPATGQVWTVAQVDALEAGMRKYDYNPGGNSETRVTTLYVTVTFQDGTTYAYNDGVTGMNELLSISGGESVAFTYTDNGEVATRTEGGVTWTYAYTAAGLLREVKEGGTVRATYAYDGLGRRVKAVESGTTTFFAYGLGMDPLFERAGTTDTRHVYAGGMRVAKLVGSAYTTYYYHGDALGSTWRITDAAKGVAFSASYEPFGRAWDVSGPLAATERYRFLGERSDLESGLTYLRARQYDARTGRFTSMDPVLGALGAPQTLNRYPYVGNNPTRYTDPTGAAMDLCGGGNPTVWGVNDATSCWLNSKSPEEKGLIAAAVTAVAVVAACAIIIVACPAVLGMWGAAIGVSGATVLTAIATASAVVAYAGVTWFSGGTPTWEGVLTAAFIGFTGSSFAIYAFSGSFGSGFFYAQPIPYSEIRSVTTSLRETGQAPPGFYQNPAIGGPRIFVNNRGLLPARQLGYYHEWDIHPFVSRPLRGGERIITGAAGEIFYTSNHYGSFVRLWMSWR